MARRTLDIRKKRAEAEAVEARSVIKSTKAKKLAKAKDKIDGAVPAVAKVRKPRVKKVKIPPRMRVRWCIYDSAMKPVALFDYNQRPAANARLAEYLEKKPTYFMQLFKDHLPVPEEVVEAK